MYVFTLNSKHYVGCSVDVRERICIHKCHLNKGNHDNIYLQRATTLYGLTNASITVEYCDNIFEQEVARIKELDCIAPKGYNMTAGGEGGNGKLMYHEPWQIKSPEGEVFTVTNMREFAREHSLSADGLCCLKQGIFKSSKGWRRADYIPEIKISLLQARGLDYCVRDPNGVEYKVTNEYQFAKQHELYFSQLAKLRNKKITHTAGWTLVPV